MQTLILLLTAAVFLLHGATGVQAQSLRGSPSSIERIYRQAVKHDLHFYETGAGVRRAADRGRFVRLSGNSDYRVSGVSYPYVLPSTRIFIQRLASQYRSQCGEKLVVTSAIRPRSIRLINSTSKTVHPTGMAVDLRKPTSGRCLRWLRETLLYVEAAGVIDAVEEFRPPHFHVAVFPNPYDGYVESRGGSTKVASAKRAAPTKTAAAKPAKAEYQVRRGDTLWSIARRHGTSVDRLKEANEIASSKLLAGQTLVIPSGR